MLKHVKSVDYLQFSIPANRHFLSGEALTTLSPLPFYKDALVYPCGTRVHAGNVKTDNVLVQMPGQACEIHAITEKRDLLLDMLKEGAKFSRVDFAVTIDGIFALEDLRKAICDGSFTCKRYEKDEPKIIVDRDNNTETVYLGDMKKRSRRGLLRAYDKGKELGIDRMLSRLELEVRAKRAQTAMWRYTHGATVGQLMRDVIEFTAIDWWDDVMGAPADTLTRLPKAEPESPIARRWHWLMVQVAPSLGKLLAADVTHGQENWNEFYNIVQINYLREKRKE